MKKILTVILVMAALILSGSTGRTFAGDRNRNEAGNKTISTKSLYSLPPAQFDENNVVIKIATIADTHIQEKNGLPSQKLVSALNQINARADSALDALLIAGDLTDYGLPEQVTELKRIFDNSKIDLNKTRFVFAIGNHEYYNSQIDGAAWNGGYLLKNVFGDEAYNGATDEEITAANYHAVVNGYDLIAINCSQYDNGVKYADSDIAWLKAQLAQASSNHPGKPIFVVSHPNITGTNFGSNDGSYWAGPDLNNVFKDYPQVIYFCGHLHYPENDERSIWQGDFTTVDVGSEYYCSNHPTDDENGKTFVDIVSGYETADYLKTSQGLYVEVDKNNNVRITRLDFANNKEIKKPWIIPAPQADKSHLLYYTPEQEAEAQGKKAPVFPSEYVIKELSKNARLNHKYQFQFTQAKDSDMVYSYQISFINKATDKVISTVSALSDFYLYANPGEMDTVLTKTIYDADNVLAPFSLGYKESYYIKIVAVNCFGLKSSPIISSVITDIQDSEGQGEQPDRPLLLQNYPNPFNPATTISYQLPKSSFVTLKVYTVLGQEVKTLVNGNQKAGSYTVTLEASKMSAGVYFYQMKTSGYSCIKKLIVLK